jgi:hypothetical protein
MNEYLKKRQEHILKGRPLPPKKTYKLKPISEKRAAKIKEQKDAGGENGLDKYFDYHMKNSLPKCDNCGMEAGWLLDEKYSFIWRSCQAHVLPKKEGIGGFPSIAANLLNHLVLFPHFAGLCNCHGQYDSSYEAMAKMAVFPKAIDIINQLYPFIAKDEIKYLQEILLQELRPEIYNSK